MKCRVSAAGLLTLLCMALLSLAVYADEDRQVTLTVLETSDVHGQLMNYDYTADKEVNYGLVKCASVIKRERALDPDLLLLDCGDTIQGNMVSEFRREKVHPVMTALNYLKYDAWELGNHEFNFEFPCLQACIKEFRGDVLGGNIYRRDGSRFAKPYIVKNIKGVKVAVIGLNAPHIPVWESDPSHYDGMKFTSPAEEAGVILRDLEAEHPDVIIALCHYGEHGEKGDKGMYEVAEEYQRQIDAFLIGHAHTSLLKYLNGSRWEDQPGDNTATCLMETGSRGRNVGKLTLQMRKDQQGRWQVAGRRIELLSCAEAEPDAELVKLLHDVHEKSMAMANRVIGEVSEDFFDDPLFLPHIPKAVLQESALLNLINKVMSENSGADVSMASLFDEKSNLHAGPFRYKDACSVYRYDNTLMAVKVTGAQLKNIMERFSGSFFNAYRPGDVTISFNPNMRLYEYDAFYGVNYEIDISQPEGRRIVNVQYKGHPLAVDEVVTLACNSYRCGQMVQEKLINADDIVYRSENLSENSEIRDMIASYVAREKRISPQLYGSWRITGCDLSDPQAELIYQMVRDGRLEIPCSANGRAVNGKSLNAEELRRQRILPPL